MIMIVINCINIFLVMGMAINMMVFGRPGSHKLSSNRNTARPEMISSGQMKKICGTKSFFTWLILKIKYLGFSWVICRFSLNQTVFMTAFFESV